MTSQSRVTRQLAILLVEDDPGDQELVRRALCRDGFEAALRIVEDGQSAIDELLLQSGPQAVRLDLVLLDLNLPRKSGLAVLEAARRAPTVRDTPIVVLTTSERERDVERCNALGCDEYLVKPLDAHDFVAALRELYARWCERLDL